MRGNVVAAGGAECRVVAGRIIVENITESSLDTKGSNEKS